MSDKTRILVVDDQTVVREGLVLLLELLPGIEVAGACGDGEQAIAMVEEMRPDVVLMDLRMPRVDGVEATRRIKEAHPDVGIVVLTTYADDESIFAALRAGARGYLTKDADADEIARAVTAVRGGASQLDPAVQRRLVEAVATGESPRRAARGELPDGLTRREAEVLTLIAQGRSNAEIAGDLFISEATVKTHINNLFAKANLRDRAQAVTYAFRHGLTG
ncbi:MULTISPECIES: response regulator [Actinomadura]|uniref:DNA-binding response regulator, NarL/FixJ family, contains REC and HTH domains n=1 Tax=Actinomadura madurae TaxID=1993 RepID=A0A1I5VUC5_9ACTN|nr:response regulator transcription factor [Actinomadura madurae]SFQ11082.1 DNA-binding response regulator, NarL/FixJ family, contains REC and HTH domains [Actinomadura madurae]SPT49571.1 Response regulator protein vraR [Actinomadura madurae]